VQGQDADFRTQIVALLPRLRRFCAALTRNGDAGDDLCQATIERALTRADQFEPGTRLDSWMYRIARNLQIDMVRRRQTRGTEIDIDDTFDIAGDDGLATVEGRSDLARAEAAMASLPEEQRALIALVVIDGQSYKEAAEVLDIPIGTVMSRIARARRAINLAVREVQP
jgi:RNA polymerase sigma-70 factor, ECF subfamily